MPRMDYEASEFPASYGAALSGAQALEFTWSELVWAAVSVGRAELMHIVRHGPFSAFEIVYRAAILFANLRETHSGHLARSAAYQGLDPSEKGAVSYFMGLAAAKLLSDRLLNVPWLMHVDVYRQELQIPGGAMRPDLVGQNAAGQWIAVESKGRTHGFSAGAMLKAKEQVETLATVKGEPVVLRVALQAHFGGGLLQCALRDPDEPRERERRIDLPLERVRFYEGYYRPYREWLATAPSMRRETVRGRNFLVADLPEVDVAVGLLEQTVKEKKPPAAERFTVEGDGVAQQEGLYIGADGVMVRAGALWSQDNMRHEPQERER
ncbi:MAG: hypothetical protein AB7H96_21270 [Vicinamibacterales bacterium]